MLELDQTTESQLSSLKTIRFSIPFDTPRVEDGAKAILAKAELPLGKVKISTEKNGVPITSTLIFKTLLDKNTCAIVSSESAIATTLMLTEALTSAEMLRRLAQGEIELGIIAPWLRKTIPDNAKILGDVSMPTAKKTAVTTGLLVGQGNLNLEAFDRTVLRGLVGLDRIVAKIGRASRSVEDETWARIIALEESRRGPNYWAYWEGKAFRGY